MNAKSINVTRLAQRGLLVAAALFLHHVATAVPTSSISDLGIVILNAESNLGDAVSVKAKMASLSGFAGAALPSLGATSAATASGHIVYLYAGGYTGDFISIGGGGGGGFTPVVAGYGGGLPMIPAGTSAPSISAAVTPGAAGTSPAVLPLSSVSPTTIPGAAGVQPGGIASAPGSLPTPLTGPAGSGGGLAALPVPASVVVTGGAPATGPSSLAPSPAGLPGTTLPLATSVPSVGGVAVVPVPLPAGPIAPVASPFATPSLVALTTVASDAVVVPDSGVTFLLFSLGLAIVLGVRGRFSAFVN